MVSVIRALINIANLNTLHIEEVHFGNNRANSVGEGLESFMKDAFAGSFGVANKAEREQLYNEVFIYEGSKRTPPDLMIKNGGPAIEVKKTEQLSAELQLNSSHPKAILKSTSTLINNHCRECEAWEERDFVYAVGHVPNGSKKLSSLWILDGALYAADEEVYLGLKESLTESIERTDDIDFSETNEIGRVNNVDPLKITHLRIRGMWLLQPPYKVFDYVAPYDREKDFQCFAIIPSSKYFAIPDEVREEIKDLPNVSITEVLVKNPNNPRTSINSILIEIEL